MKSSVPNAHIDKRYYDWAYYIVPTDKIGQEIENLNGISGDVVGALNKIKQAIQNVSEYVTTTAAAVEEQSTVTSEMSSNMQRAAAEAAAIARG